MPVRTALSLLPRFGPVGLFRVGMGIGPVPAPAVPVAAADGLLLIECLLRFGRQALEQSSVSHSTRFPRLSSRVRRMVGSRIRRTRPGNPAPVPTSMSFLPPRARVGRRAALSRKCRVITSAGSVMAVRFITWFFSSSRRQ